jgi:hypothetical protein
VKYGKPNLFTDKWKDNWYEFVFQPTFSTISLNYKSITFKITRIEMKEVHSLYSFF